MAVEEALRESDKKNQMILNSAAEAIYGIDNSGNCTFCNESCLNILGYKSPDDLLGRNMHLLIHSKHADGTDFPVEKCRIFQAFKTGEKNHVDDEVLWRSDGSSFPAEYWSYPQINNGAVVGAVVTFLDITERKISEEKVRKLLEEKELILKEVHHRIKNNMNVIHGLLMLQSYTLKDDAAVTALENSASRVQSMMILYDKLYRMEDVQNIHVKEYLPALVDEIAGNLSKGKPVKIKKEINDFVLDTKRLQTLGIIINELLTNSMKYAIAGKDDGLIKIYSALNDKIVTVVIEDNGPGIPESVDFGSSSGFGLQLVGMLTKELQGEIHIERNKGTKIILKFPI
jgi:PAS domain S-box-containing protein